MIPFNELKVEFMPNDSWDSVTIIHKLFEYTYNDINPDKSFISIWDESGQRFIIKFYIKDVKRWCWW